MCTTKFETFPDSKFFASTQGISPLPGREIIISSEKGRLRIETFVTLFGRFDGMKCAKRKGPPPLSLHPNITYQVYYTNHSCYATPRRGASIRRILAGFNRVLVRACAHVRYYAVPFDNNNIIHFDAATTVGSRTWSTRRLLPQLLCIYCWS